MFRASGQSDCISRCSTVPFQPVTYSLLQDQMRPGSGSEGKAAGFITPLRQPGSVGSPCVFTCTVAWNACAFHFNLPCHLKPPGAHFEDGKNSIPGLSPVWGLLFSPVPPTCHPRFWHRGATDRMFASLTQILHIQGVVQQSDLGLLHRCLPRAHECVHLERLELDFESL